VLPELHDSEAALAQVADLFILLHGVYAAQGLEDAVEMGGLTAFFVGDRRCQITNRFLAQRALGKLYLRFASIPSIPGSGFAVMTQNS
jgi:hypothetical protein